ncbi:hypothetical protein K439DRAFT_1661699 [Ramaria rubella]|nr:hypothetical protein K439DRAFT_1661699 [Ramaria rubella]
MSSSSHKPIKLRIPKLPIEQLTKPAPRKVNKRRITSDDDDSDGVASPSTVSLLPKPPAKKARLSHPDDSEFEPDVSYPGPPPSKPTTAQPVGISKGSSKKASRIVSDENDDEFIPDPEEKPAVAASKHKMRDPKGKMKLGSSSGVTGAKITAKNEGKSVEPPVPHENDVKKKRKREEEGAELDVGVDITSVPAHAPSPVPPTPPASHVEPPRKKLPTIKKKPKTDTAPSTVASPAPPKAAIASATKLTGSAGTGAANAKSHAPAAGGPPKKPTTGHVQATIMNPSGTGDFDLRDSNTWQSLIGKGTSISGPRVGIEKRVSAEERRKQLDKMRDEARARREEHYRHTFDLQAQSQKIATFEASVLPPILDARFDRRTRENRRNSVLTALDFRGRMWWVLLSK